jgi:single-strand DNA-binding protein
MSFVTVCGRLGRDSEFRTVGDNQVLNFSVAEDIGYGDKRKTQWWSCALWGKRGEKLEQYLTKGTPVTVVGNPELREYDKKDGTRGAELTVRVIDVTLQGSRSGGEAQEPREEKPAAGGTPDKGEFDDEIPF